MKGSRSNDRRVMGGGAAVLMIVMLPLWTEFRESGNLAWNAFLAIFLTGLAVGVFYLQRYLQKNVGEVGEARFDTRNRTNG